MNDATKLTQEQANFIANEIMPNNFFNVEKRVFCYVNDINFTRYNDIGEKPTVKESSHAIQQGKMAMDTALGMSTNQ